MVYSASLGYQRRLLSAYGWSSESPEVVDWKTLIANQNTELDRLHGFYEKLLDASGVHKISGTARLLSSEQVEVEGNRYHARTILLALGGKPWVPDDLLGLEHAMVSDQVFSLSEFPRAILIIGSGYIGTEFAGIFRGLGAEVHQAFRSELVLSGFDRDLRALVDQQMQERGVTIHRKNRLLKLAKSSNHRISATLSESGSLEVDQVLLATGRRPRTRGIGLEEVGVRLGDQDQILVDASLQTSIPGIYAVGDCLKGHELTPVAIAQGRALAEHLFNSRPFQVDLEDLPTAVFSSPPAASVGATEQQLRQRGVGFHVYKAVFRPMKYTLPKVEAKAMLKLLVDSVSDRVLGCHLVGEDAPEVIQALGICLKAKATKAQFDQTVAVHPTFAEELVLMRNPSETVPARQ